MPPSPAGKKTKNLLAEIDAAKEEDTGGPSQLLTCNKIWYEFGANRKKTSRLQVADLNHREKLQSCPSVQSGEFDLDGLCNDLQKKAKCSGSGAVVDEKDFKNVMQKYLCKEPRPETTSVEATMT